MAATGYTPISLYYSTTASAVPTAGNLANGELALNIADMKLYAKNGSGVVTLLASNASTTGVDSLSFGSTGLTPSTATTGAITVAGTLNVANGGTGQTSFTANRLLYGNGTGGLNSSAGLTFDGTTLATTGAVSTSNVSGYNVQISGGNAYRMYADTNNLVFRSVTAGSDVLTLAYAGNLGLGVTPSAWTAGKALQLAGTGLSGSVFMSDTGVLMLSNNYRYSGGDVYNATGYATRYYQYAGQHIWNTAPSGTAGTAISFTQAMTLDANGRLMVGTTSGTTKVDVRGTSNTVESTIQIVGNTVSSLLLGQNADGGVVRGQGGNNALTFWTGGSGDTGAGLSGTERFRIGSAGQWGIGGANYGTTGQVLTSQGSGSAPTWSTVAAGGFSTMVTYTSSTTFTIPSGKTSIKVTVIGGGGGARNGSKGGGYGGGGGGGAAIQYFTGLTPGNTLTVTVGAGGAVGGSAGGTTSVSSGTQVITTVQATGGDGAPSNQQGAAGGIGSGGAANIKGGSSTGVQGASERQGGIGGNSIYGGGGKGGVNATSNGEAGGAYGGGGGGGAGGSRAGAAGAAGAVIIEY